MREGGGEGWERGEPPQSVALGGAGKTEGAGSDAGDVARTLVQHRRPPVRHAKPSEVQRRDHALRDAGRRGIRTHGPVQVNRCVLKMKIERSTTQASAALPRHLPQDMIAPTPIPPDQTAPR